MEKSLFSGTSIQLFNSGLFANNPELKSWIEVPENSDFSIQNIPFGVAKSGKQVFVASRIGDTVINLHQLAKLGYFDVDSDVFKSYKLNKFIKLGKAFTRQVRDEISVIFSLDNVANKDNEKIKAVLYSINEVEMLMPVRVGDYTDFYSSEQHAYNVGCMFRDPNNALLPNWKHIPVGYHGRSSSIVVSGTPIHRPKGQQKPNDNEPPVFGPCKLLDFELEMAISNSKSNNLQGPNTGGSLSFGFCCPFGRCMGVPETTIEEDLPW